jgi:hypothetical protein
VDQAVEEFAELVRVVVPVLASVLRDAWLPEEPAYGPRPMLPHGRADYAVSEELMLLIPLIEEHCREGVEAPPVGFGKRRAIQHAIPEDSNAAMVAEAVEARSNFEFCRICDAR